MLSRRIFSNGLLCTGLLPLAGVQAVASQRRSLSEQEYIDALVSFARVAIAPGDPDELKNSIVETVLPDGWVNYSFTGPLVPAWQVSINYYQSIFDAALSALQIDRPAVAKFDSHQRKTVSDLSDVVSNSVTYSYLNA